MKLADILEFKIPLTVTSLRAWPSPTKGEQHSGIQNLQIDPSKKKIPIPNRRKLKRFLKPVKDQISQETK